MKNFLFLLLIVIGLLQTSRAAEDYYRFDNQQQQQRFEVLTSQLRCLVCQNQNLAESNAALANDLRNQVYQQIQSGQSDQQIMGYLVARYGDFILYRPPLSIGTMALWFGPFLVLFIGISYLIYYLHKNKRQRE